MKGLLTRYPCVCKRCGAKWDAKKVHPIACVNCRTRAWDKEPDGKENVIYIPVPKVDHSIILELPFIGAKCPYCNGTTGIDGYKGTVICYSCDAVFSITKPMVFLGVIAGIGAK